MQITLPPAAEAGGADAVTCGEDPARVDEAAGALAAAPRPARPDDGEVGQPGLGSLRRPPAHYPTLIIQRKRGVTQSFEVTNL